jgi:hypothetical protein
MLELVSIKSCFTGIASMQKKFHQSLVALGSISLILATVGIAQADTVKARCDVYPKGEDKATSSDTCTFSQRQGNVGIQLKNGTRYDLTPVGDQPGNYVDQNGQAAYRQSGLGEAGQIYRLADQSIYVYWAEGHNHSNHDNGNKDQTISQSNSANPLTKMTRRQNQSINVEITEGEFEFYGVLKPSTEKPNTFIGEDDQVRVFYDRNIGQITIINKKTGDLFYQYNYTDVDEGSL